MDWIRVGSNQLLKRAETEPDVAALLDVVDVLVDGPYIEAQRDISLPWAGSNNQRVIDVKRSLKKNEVVLWKEN